MQVATVIPTVTSATTSLAANAASYTINGFGFSTTFGNNTVALTPSGTANVTASTATTITFTINANTLTAGALNAVVTVSGVSSGTAVQVATVTPVVTSSTTNLAANSATMTINGTGFSTTAGNNTLVFNNGVTGTVSSATGTALQVTFGAAAKPTTVGSLTVVVTSNLSSSGAAVQVATVIPTVTSATTSLAANATSYTINGFGFSTTFGNNTVALTPSGTANVTASTANTITFNITGTLTAGPLNAVVTVSGINSGAAVQVATVAPVVTTSTASLAANAATMTITGSGFSTTQANNVVIFNDGATGNVTSASAGSLTVTFGFKPTNAGVLTATVTVNGVSNGSAVQVATVIPVVSVSTTSISTQATTLTINGFGFASANANNSVAFSPSGAGTVTSSSPNQIVVTFNTQPTAGALAAIVTSNSVASGSAVQVATEVAPPVITTASLANWTVNQAGYSQTVAATTSGGGAISFSVSSGSLPTGLALTSASGLISGTPTVANTFNFTINATDSLNGFTSQAYTVVINAAVVVSTTSVSNWTVNQPGYGQQISTSGGTGQATFAVTGGALPPGLTLATGGALGGTPTATGPYSFTVTATDVSGAKASQAFSLVINAAVSITTTSLPTWTSGLANYSATLTSTGGTGGNSYAINTGSLPAGLTLSPAGALTGTPTGAGTYNITVAATDSVNAFATQSLTIIINAAVTITPASMPNWDVNLAGYSQTVTSANGTGTRTLSISSGAVPTGMIFTAATGVLNGTPTASGTFNFTVTATDSVGATAAQPYTIVINAAVTITTTTLADWTISKAGYSRTVAATGGAGGYSFSVTTGTVPAGLTFTSAGLLSGTPTTAGASTFIVTATDSLGATGTQSYTVTINAAVSVTPATLPNWTQNATGYSRTVTSANGTGTRTLSLSSGAVPTGMTFIAATGVLNGTPSATGTFNFTVTATDAVGATGSQAYTVVIGPALVITTPSLQNWTVNQAGYSQTLAYTGGTGTSTFSVGTGTLPTGLTLAGSGALTGTPTATGTFNFDIAVTDSVNASVSKSFTITIGLGVTINTTSLPAWTAKKSNYSQTLSATGGTGTITFKVSAGALPSPMTLSTAGVLAGTPATAGTYNFTVMATDSVSNSSTQALSLVINPVNVLSPGSLPDWTVNLGGYSKTITSTGGTGSKTLQASTGAIPPGLNMDLTTGILSGTPNQTGTYSFTIAVFDSVGAIGSATYHVTINDVPTLDPSTLPGWTLNQPGYNQTLIVNGGTGLSTLALTGTLPTGLSFDSVNGILSGTPTAIGSYHFTITATDAVGASSSQPFTVVITPAPPTLSTPTSAAIGGTLATLGGTVVIDGGATVTSRGVVIAPSNVNPQPAIGGAGVTVFTTTGTTGAFTVNATGLTPATSYSYVAYATNNQGTGYTSAGTFATLSSDSTLSALGLSKGTLSPAFGPTRTAYSMVVPNVVSSLVVTPTPNQANATIKVGSTAVSAASPSVTSPLVVGANTITTVVTAQDGITTSTYTISITRLPGFISVQQGTLLSNGLSVVNFGGVLPGKSASLVFTVRNLSNTTLQDFILAFSGANASEFSLTKQPATSLAPNATTTFTVAFQPTVIGTRTAAVQIDATGESLNPFVVNLTGAGDTQPAFNSSPASKMAGVGQDVSFTADAGGGGLSYTWLKNNAAVAGATGSVYDIPAAALSNAGVYSIKVTNAAGSASSGSANLGIINTAASIVRVVQGNTLTLTASAAGPGLTYQWQKHGLPLSNGTNPGNSASTISGATTSKLTITKMATSDADGYSCLVSMPDLQNAATPLSLSTGVFTVKVTIKPVLNAFTPGPWIVGGTVTDVITADNDPTAFTVSGLPPGVSVLPSGQLTGKPTVILATATTYNLVIGCSNAAGAALVSLHVQVIVNPLQDNAIGTFNGLVDRDDVLSSTYGGSLNVVTLGTGVFTGRLMLGATAYSFSGQHLDAVIGGNPSATVVIPRKAPLTSLTLTFDINKDTGGLTGGVTDGVIATPVNVAAWRNPWNATSNKCTMAATFTSALRLDHEFAGTGTAAANVAYPQGTSYGTLTVTTAGAATWSGRMADGAVTTLTTTMGPNGAVPLFFALYSGKGSTLGWANATADNATTPVNGGLRLLDGTVDWNKTGPASSTDRTYSAAIPINTLTLAGGEYVKPAAAVLDLQNNASLTFTEGGLTGPAPIAAASMASALNLSVRITSTNVVVLPSVNSAALSLGVSATHGTFGGSFTLSQDPDPTAAKPTLLSRKVFYSGLFITRLGIHQGLGFFLLPELPVVGPPKTTLATSPILSGNVVLQ